MDLADASNLDADLHANDHLRQIPTPAPQGSGAAYLDAPIDGMASTDHALSDHLCACLHALEICVEEREDANLGLLSPPMQNASSIGGPFPPLHHAFCVWVVGCVSSWRQSKCV
jgi:hypothetical protein